MLKAYCFRDGHVVTTIGEVPEGSVELFRGPDADVIRLAKATTDDEGFIPGLRESTTVADDQQHLLLYLEEVRAEASRLVTVSDLTQDILEAEGEA